MTEPRELTDQEQEIVAQSAERHEDAQKGALEARKAYLEAEIAKAEDEMKRLTPEAFEEKLHQFESDLRRNKPTEEVRPATEAEIEDADLVVEKSKEPKPVVKSVPKVEKPADSSK